jgi:hemerythrin-like domain-containing protein
MRSAFSRAGISKWVVPIDDTNRKIGVLEVVIDYCLDYPDQCHHPKEDIVYAQLRERDPAVASKIGDLKQEHVKLAVLTQVFSNAVRQVHADAKIKRDQFMSLARRFIDGYRRHMELGETVYFPSALASFMEEDWLYVDARVTKRNDSLFGAQVAQQFPGLCDAILPFGSARIWNPSSDRAHPRRLLTVLQGCLYTKRPHKYLVPWRR